MPINIAIIRLTYFINVFELIKLLNTMPGLEPNTNLCTLSFQPESFPYLPIRLLPHICQGSFVCLDSCLTAATFANHLKCFKLLRKLLTTSRRRLRRHLANKKCNRLSFSRCVDTGVLVVMRSTVRFQGAISSALSNMLYL